MGTQVSTFRGEGWHNVTDEMDLEDGTSYALSITDRGHNDNIHWWVSDDATPEEAPAAGVKGHILWEVSDQREYAQRGGRQLYMRLEHGKSFTLAVTDI